MTVLIQFASSPSPQPSPSRGEGAKHSLPPLTCDADCVDCPLRAVRPPASWERGYPGRVAGWKPALLEPRPAEAHETI